MILVSHLNPKFAKVPAEHSRELRVRDTRADVRRGESKALDLSWAGIGEPLGAVNDNGAKIIDVGARRTCLYKVADPGKKTG